MFVDIVKNSTYSQVILMSGGAASGKTEFVATYLSNEPVVIYDGTLPSFEGAKIKVKFAHKYGKEVRVVGVWPGDFLIAFAAFLQRDRKFPDKHFYETHSKSRTTLLEIARSDLDVDIELYENEYEDGRLTFYKYAFSSKAALLAELERGQYTEEQLVNIITSHA